MYPKTRITRDEVERLIVCARVSIDAHRLEFLGQYNRLPTDEEIQDIAIDEFHTIHSAEAMLRRFFPKNNEVPSSLLVQLNFSELLP